jgi:hypothetical protein
MTLVAAFGAGLFAAESQASAFSAGVWTFIGLPPDNSVPKLIAAYQAGLLVSTSTGIWEYPAWHKRTSYSGAKSLAADAVGRAYILDSLGHPLVYDGVSHITNLPAGFNWAVPRANNQPGGSGSAICPNPSELALGSGNVIWVIGCRSSSNLDFIYSNTINGNSNWGTSIYVSLPGSKYPLKSIGGNTLFNLPWTVDNTGFTYLGSTLRSNGCCIQYTTAGAQVIGDWGTFDNAIAIPTGGLNANGDYPIALWSGGPNGSWSWPYYGGYAHAISVESYTTVALATYAQDVFINTFD